MKHTLSFFGLAYLISWTLWLPLYAYVFGINKLPVLPYNHALGGLGPMLAAIILTAFYEGRAGLKSLLKNCLKVKQILYLSIALLGPFILGILASFISYFLQDSPPNLSGFLHNKEFPEFGMLTFFAYNLLFFGFGEEIGWRGFALPRIQNKMNALSASLLLTGFWALWHLPLFFYRSGYTGMDVAGIGGWVFSLLTGSILLTWLYNSSGGSILICAVLHSTVDMAFTADIPHKNLVNYMGFLITVWGIVTIVYFKPENLSTSIKQRSE